MSYESFVEVQDLKKNKKFPFHIHMNHPLVYNGYKFFQASYTQNPGEPEVSIFAVKRDPGVPLIYGGSAILIAGILILFYGKPKEKEKTRKKK
jgi:cytochrome c biogenesis protein ResB